MRGILAGVPVLRAPVLDVIEGIEIPIKGREHMVRILDDRDGQDVNEPEPRPFTPEL